MKKNRRGFTLVELMVVVAIIGLLATVVTVSVISQKEGADRVRVQADMKVIGDALDLFKLNLGYYPNSLEELNTRPSRNGNKWRGPYLKEFPPRDPWGNVYEYTAGSGRAGDYEITSYGGDGAPGGVESAEDLSSKTINQVDGN
jgi:general secretion pathway protein G